MSWTSVGTIIPSERAYAGLQAGGFWMFRTALDVFACRLGEAAPIWEARLDRSQDLIGPKLLASADKRAVTIEDFGSKSGAQVIALDMQTGKRLWKQTLDGAATPFGLAIIGDHVWLLVRRKDLSNQLVKLDARQGNLLEELPCPDANGIVAVGHDLLIQAVAGLQILKGAEGKPRPLTTVQPQHIAIEGKLAYWHEMTDAPGSSLRFVCYDLSQEKAWGREVTALSNEAGVKKIVPLGEAGQAATLHDSGFVVLDLAEGLVRVTVDLPEGMRSVALVATPESLVLACAMRRGRSKVLVYSQAGEPTGELPVEELRPSFLAYSEGVLAVNGPDGVQFLEWQDGKPATHQKDTSRSNVGEPAEASIRRTRADPFAPDIKPLESGPKREKLEALVEEFLASMKASAGSDEQREHGQKFNRLYDDFVRAYPEEDATTFAVRVSLMGISYEDAYRDVIYVRGLGIGS